MLMVGRHADESFALTHKGRQRLIHLDQLQSLRTRIMNSMDDDLFEIEEIVGQLPLSCHLWAKENVPSLKLGKTACSIFRKCMYAPNIFDEPAYFRFVDIAELADCAESTARTAIGQLEAFGLADQRSWGDWRKLALAVPDDDLIESHDERMKLVWTVRRGKRPWLTFRQALPLWTEFTASFAALGT